MGHQSKLEEIKTDMNESLDLNNKDYYFFSFSASIVLHIIVLLICFILLKKGDDSYLGKGIAVQMIQNEYPKSDPDEINKGSINKQEPQKAENSNKTAPLNTPDNKIYQPSGYYNFDGTGNDTSGLVQVYSEKTLNVKIKYPVGWTFVDQDRHNKLDGVTFWANNGIFDPPPYIFLEVKDKNLFNPSRFIYNTKLDNSVAYYNDPEELEGQVSQVFYIRTETDEDYSIKLIMNGKNTFHDLQPLKLCLS